MKIKCILTTNVLFTLKQFFDIQIIHYLHINNYTWSDYQMLILVVIWLKCSTQNICSFLRAKINFKKICLSNELSLMLLRSLVNNSPPAENTRSVSTEVGGTIWRDWWSSCNSAHCFLPTMKSPIFLAKVSWTSELISELCCFRKSDSCFAMNGTDVTTSTGSSQGRSLAYKLTYNFC